MQVLGPEGVRTARTHSRLLATVDPDTLERDPEVLHDIGRRFGGRLALNADVAQPGSIAVGDAVRLVHGRARLASETARSGNVERPGGMHDAG